MRRPFLEAVLVFVALAVIGLISLWLQQPLLAPSLGSAVFAQVMSPQERASQPWDIGVGQLVGAAAGFIAVYVSFATTAPTFFGDHHLVAVRVLAVSIAVALTVGGETLLNANSPPGGATAIVVAIGVESATWSGAGRTVAAILLITVLGEAARKIVLRRG